MAAEVSIVIKVIDESTKQINKMRGPLKEFGKDMLKGAAGVTAFGFAAKKAFDLGQQAAQMRQMVASGEALGINLEALRRASRGTISDFSLSASTQTLLIGTQGDLKDAFLDNADQLLAIAKAANKLNPALGTTEFLYQSIAKGIKRGSPLILDNLGLIVKLGRANSIYAEEIGKAVSELSAEERTQALLNETLRAGQVILEQANASVDTGVDAYAKLTASVQNYGLALAETAATEGSLLSNLNNLIGTLIEERTIINELNALREQGVVTQDEMNEAFTLGVLTNKEYARTLVESAEAKDILINETEEFIPELAQQFALMEEGTDTTEGLTDEMNDLALAESGVSVKAQEATRSMLSFFEAADPSKLSDFQKNLENIDFVRAGGGQIQQFGEDLEEAIEAGTIGMREIEKASQAGFLATEALNVELGNTTAAEAAAAVMERLPVGPAEALALVNDLDGALKRLKDVDLTVTITQVIVGAGALKPGAAVGSGAGAVGAGEFLSKAQSFATGGSFLVGGSGGTDSQFVGFMATPGEEVSVGTPGQQRETRGGDTINNFNAPVNISSSDTELLMQMGLDISGARVP